MTKIEDQLHAIIDENLDPILEIVKSNLLQYEPEPDYVILKALKEYFK